MNRRRPGFTLVEALVFGAVCMMLVGVLVSVLASTWRRDTSTSGWLDAVSVQARLLAHLREDLWLSHTATASSGGRGLVLDMHGDGSRRPVNVAYTWAGKDAPLERGG